MIAPVPGMMRVGLASSGVIRVASHLTAADLRSTQAKLESSWLISFLALFQVSRVLPLSSPEVDSATVGAGLGLSSCGLVIGSRGEA